MDSFEKKRYFAEDEYSWDVILWTGNWATYDGDDVKKDGDIYQFEQPDRSQIGKRSHFCLELKRYSGSICFNPKDYILLQIFQTTQGLKTKQKKLSSSSVQRKEEKWIWIVQKKDI